MFKLETDKGDPETTIPMILTCPSCGERHIDEQDFAEVAHHTHACQGCGLVWRPAKVNTHGVRFLPGYKTGTNPMINPTQDSLDFVARLNGYRDWASISNSGGGRRAMRLHAIDRDKWLTERQPVNWQDNMDFEPSAEALGVSAKDLIP